MMKYVLAAVVVLALAGCTTTNHSIGSAQFNSATEAYPGNYREAALRLIDGRDTIAPLQISEPATMAGEGPFSPQRWFVCARGIAPKGQVPRMTAQEHWDGLITPRSEEPNYDVVVIFREGHHPFTTEGYRSRLCRDVSFGPI